MTNPVPVTRAALARRYRVDRSAITRALQQAAQAHAADPTCPAPPRPLNAGETTELFNRDEFDAFWAARPRRGRPRTALTPTKEQ